MDEEVPPTVPMRTEWENEPLLPPPPGEQSQHFTCILNAIGHFPWIFEDWASVLRRQQTNLAAQCSEQSARFDRLFAALDRVEHLLMRQPSEPWRSQGRTMQTGTKLAGIGKSGKNRQANKKAKKAKKKSKKAKKAKKTGKAARRDGITTLHILGPMWKVTRGGFGRRRPVKPQRRPAAA